ncbi:hypothetical protein FEM48_Zijuj02G0036200 [Ziziphus jujuba var. spinosa]|uniref:Retrotransposon gag domain-containing protein n=1 Tax=Ziziphus jujuba var. spinosa TaxID=714518 RepID=A0A978VTE3_ZIZJJ|nr:hypothetical protein FEM48_Zijuj02G0036200 [Ziziphus jujuba var. spinosa]
MPSRRRDINNLGNVPAVNQENAPSPQGNAQAPQVNDFTALFQNFMQAMTNAIQQQPHAGNATISWDVERNPITWVRFKELFYDKYFPQTWRDNKIAEFIELSAAVANLWRGFQRAQILKNDDEMSMKAKSKERGRSPSWKRTWDKNKKQRSDGRRGDQKKIKNEQFGRMEYPTCETYEKKHPDMMQRLFTVASTISISGHSAFVLMDFSSTHCFVSHNFACKLDLKLMNLDCEICVATPSGEIIMDWLAAYHVSVKHFEKEVVFQPEGEDEIKFIGVKLHPFPRVISALQARRCLRKGCRGFLASIVDTSKEDLTIHDVQIVNEFADVFPDKLPRILPKRGVDFVNDTKAEFKGFGRPTNYGCEG